MKILLVTENPDLRHSLREGLSGHLLTEFPDEWRRAAPPRTAFDCVMIDPDFDPDLRGRIATIRRGLAIYTYIVAVTKGADLNDQPWLGSVNALLPLPLRPDAIASMLDDLRQLQDTVRHLGDQSEDFPSAGGIISRSAFNQIFLSGMDRAGRYNERPSMLFFRIANFREIQQLDGSLAADELAARLAQLLTRLRRQSDIIAQTGRGEFCLLLQRPQTETETVEAARRFAEGLGQADLENVLLTDVPVDIELFELPSGSITARHHVIYGAAMRS